METNRSEDTMIPILFVPICFGIGWLMAVAMWPFREKPVWLFFVVLGCSAVGIAAMVIPVNAVVARTGNHDFLLLAPVYLVLEFCGLAVSVKRIKKALRKAWARIGRYEQRWPKK